MREIADFLSNREKDPIRCSHVTVKKDIDATLDELKKDSMDDAERWRTIEDRRLLEGQKAISTSVAAGDLGAIDRMIKISESRRKLWGWDKQAEVNVSGTLIMKGYGIVSPDDWPAPPGERPAPGPANPIPPEGQPA